jgi:hypothetical protein
MSSIFNIKLVITLNKRKKMLFYQQSSILNEVKIFGTEVKLFARKPEDFFQGQGAVNLKKELDEQKKELEKKGLTPATKPPSFKETEELFLGREIGDSTYFDQQFGHYERIVNKLIKFKGYWLFISANAFENTRSDILSKGLKMRGLWVIYQDKNKKLITRKVYMSIL